ncbi:MAG: hypothetical protein KDA96_12340 [Planctomycetaceae bacterium]|nr:hypothetical protein [Planctomycetaceae bacterium]
MPTAAHVSISSRFDLCGGFTDIIPELPGAVLSCAVDVGQARTRVDGHRLEAPCANGGQLTISVNGEPVNGMLRGALSAWCDHHRIRPGFQLDFHSHLPLGSGLGVSSQLVAAGIACLAQMNTGAVDLRDAAQEAFRFETKFTSCGWQDQMPLVCGGFAFVSASNSQENGHTDVRFEELCLGDRFLTAFQERTVLAWTGQSHFSRENLDAVKELVSKRAPHAMEALDRLRGLASSTRDLVLGADQPEPTVTQLGRLVMQNWDAELLLTEGRVECQSLRPLETHLRKLGGFKLLGAGAGGMLLVIANSREDRCKVETLLKRHGMSLFRWVVANHPAVVA